MSESESILEPLETIIKVEPEEFEETEIADETNYCRSDENHSGSVTANEEKARNGQGSSSRSCSLCEKVFSKPSVLQNHLASVHFRNEKLGCDLCQKFFFTKACMTQHMTVHREKKFVCNVCDYKTAAKASFQKHKLTHAEKVECPVCTKLVASLKEHTKTHKPKASCPICQKMFAYKYIQRHMKAHKSRSCAKCNGKFETKEELKR